jgi:hypothetical protein
MKYFVVALASFHRRQTPQVGKCKRPGSRSGYSLISLNTKTRAACKIDSHLARLECNWPREIIDVPEHLTPPKFNLLVALELSGPYLCRIDHAGPTKSLVLYRVSQPRNNMADKSKTWIVSLSRIGVETF